MRPSRPRGRKNAFRIGRGGLPGSSGEWGSDTAPPYRQGVLHLGGSTHRPWRLTTQPTDPEAKWVVVYSLGDGADKGIYYDADPTEHIGHHLTMSRVDMVEVDQQAGGEHERQMQDDEAQNQTSPRKCTERAVWMLKSC